jgi:hypothetical protein
MNNSNLDVSAVARRTVAGIYVDPLAYGRAGAPGYR